MSTAAVTADASPESLRERTEALFIEHRQEVFKSTDRMFLVLLCIEWACAFVAAIWISPRTWAGSTSSIHLHVWLALLIGGPLTLLPAYQVLTRAGQPLTRYSIAINQMLYSALLIHLTGGRIETHFHIFGSLAFLAFYRDWRVLVPATIVVALDHLLRGAFWPQSVFGVLSANPWRWVEHAGWVVFEDVFLVLACLRGVREMRRISQQRAYLEATNHIVRREVELQTANLASSEVQYRELFEANATPMWIFECDTGRIVAVNESALVEYGFARAEFLGMDSASITLEPERQGFGVDGPLLREPRQTRHRLKDGSIRDVSVVSQKSTFGGRPAVLVAAQDISRRLRVERLIGVQHAVVRILARSQSSVRASADVLAELCRTLGWALGMAWILDPATGRLCCVEKVSRAPDRFDAFLQNSAAHGFEPLEDARGLFLGGGLTNWRPDLGAGQPSPRAQAALQCGLCGVMTVPIISGEKSLGVIELFSDTRRDVDNAVLSTLESLGRTFGEFIERTRLVERVMLLADIVDVSDDAIYGIDRAGVVLTWNSGAEALYGFTADEMIGTSVERLSPPGVVGEIEELLSRMRARVKLDHYETARIRKDGSTVIVSLMVSPIRDADGTINGVSCIARNVTEQKKLQRQLLQAQKLESIGQLAAGIAHEINTPTQFAGDNVAFASRAVAHLEEHYRQLDATCPAAVASTGEDLEFLRSELPEALKAAQDGLQRISTIVGAMKEFSHPGTREKSATDINRALRSTLTVSNGEYKLLADVREDLAADLPFVHCLAAEINQVLLNLVVNAAHAIREAQATRGAGRGIIGVSTRAIDGGVEIRVSDTGNGIPEEIRSRVYEPFFTTKVVGKGTGQGLAIAHDVIVVKHGGTIDFESRPGEGTMFVVTLPLGGQDVPRELAA